MNSVGEIIQSARLAKNISLKDVSSELKISEKILNDFENDNILKDYNIVFYIGHLRSYCNFLNLNSEDIISQFKIQISFKKNYIIPEIAKPTIQNNSFNFLRFVPVSLILIIFLSFFYLFVKEDNSKQYALIPDLPESYEALIEKADLQSSQPKQIDKLQNVKSNSINSSSVIASNNINETSLKNTITLKLLNPTWLQLRDESNNIIISKLMEKDEEFTYAMELGYNITAGNAGNVLVIIDSDVRGKIGKYGEIVDSIILDYNFNN